MNVPAPLHFAHDVFARRVVCGKRSIVRTTSPGLATCVACIAKLDRIVLEPQLTREQRTKARTLAAVSGLTVNVYLERRLVDLLDGLPEPLSTFAGVA